VRLSEGGWALEGLGSTNGTFLFTRPVERSELWQALPLPAPSPPVVATG
jgi:hypothetical protein